jgi:hypothetical protein
MAAPPEFTELQKGIMQSSIGYHDSKKYGVFPGAFMRIFEGLQTHWGMQKAHDDLAWDPSSPIT